MSQSSRREFVAGLLGAAAAELACRGKARALPDGELIAPGKQLGHRLRDLTSTNAAFDLAASGALPERSTRVAVVGGGVSGLAAAWWLERAGVHDTLVLELDDVAGGTSRSGRCEIAAYPWGGHYIVAPGPEQTSLIRLLGEVGALEPAPPGSVAVAEQVLCRELEERLYYRGRWYDGLYLHAGASLDDLAQLERFQSEIGRWAEYRDASGRRAFAFPAASASDAAEVTALDRQSFASWLDARALTSPRLRWLMDYACRDDYGLRAEDTSAWAGVGYFAARIAGAGAEPQPVLTWPEGNGRLVSHLSGVLGARVLLGHAVAQVRAAGGGVELTALSASGAVRIRAERAIVATPLHVSQRIVAGLTRARPRVALDRGAWAVANLHLSERPQRRHEDAPLAWDNVLYDSPSLGYVVATHQSGRDHGPSVFTWYYPFTGDGASARRALDGAGREEWAAAALADLARAHPDLPELCRRIDVAYWGHGMARPRVGSIFDPALRAARLPFGPVHFAGSELSGLSLFEEALDQGVRAAQEVLAALGRPA